MQSITEISNPNLFELNGNKYFNTLFLQSRNTPNSSIHQKTPPTSSITQSNRHSPYTHGACMSSPHLFVVTVNRVQDTFEVPIYELDTRKCNISTFTRNKYDDGDLKQIPEDNLDFLNSLVLSPNRKGEAEVEMGHVIPTLDFHKYYQACSLSPCAHIGDLYLITDDMQYVEIIPRPLSVVQVRMK